VSGSVESSESRSPEQEAAELVAYIRRVVALTGKPKFWLVHPSLRPEVLELVVAELRVARAEPPVEAEQ
jgi:hypothetical protein